MSLIDYIRRTENDRRRISLLEVAETRERNVNIERNEVLDALQKKHTEAAQKVEMEHALEMSRLRQQLEQLHRNEEANKRDSNTSQRSRDESKRIRDDMDEAAAKYSERIRQMVDEHKREKVMLEKAIIKLTSDPNRCSVM
jgi:hypothetical protein